jgi:hypothetical protein
MHEALCCFSTRFEASGWSVMDKDIEEMMLLAERLMLHMKQSIPPEAEVIESLQSLIDRVRKKYNVTPPIAPSLPE